MQDCRPGRRSPLLGGRPAQGGDRRRVGKICEPLRRGLTGGGGTGQRPLRQLARTGVGAQNPLRQAPVGGRGAHGRVRHRRQELGGQDGEELQSLQGIDRIGGIAQALTDQVGMGGRPCPDLPGVVPLPRPLHEVRADGQARLEQGLLNGARVKAARDIAVQQPRDARVVGVSLEPAQVQQAQLGACEQLVPDRVATGDAQGLITRAVGDRHNAVEDVVGDLLQLMPLGLEVEGIDIRQFLDSGSDPPA